MNFFLYAWAAIASAAWCASALRVLAAARAMRLLRKQHPPSPSRWPRLSVLVPACNEARSLPAALESLLAQDYPNMEVVLVNDRSSDNTGSIVTEAAARDPRVVPLHVEELPSGWLGKVHALEAASRKATGEWLLFTDADVHFSPGVLKKAVAFCLAERRDHVAVVPEVRAKGLWLQAAIAAAAYFLFLRVPPSRVGRPGSKTVMGVGAFNLVRTEALARTQGLEWLRMEVIDDYALALMLHRAGARAALLGGAGELAVTWYASLRSMLRGMDKSGFGIVRYSVARLAAALFAIAAGVAGPLGALLAGGAPFHWLPAALAYVSVTLCGAAAARRLGWSGWAGLLIPVGLLICTWSVIRSAILCLMRGGALWRGTTYPLKELRAMQRVKL